MNWRGYLFFMLNNFIGNESSFIFGFEDDPALFVQIASLWGF